MEREEKIRKKVKENKKWGAYIFSPVGYGKTFLLKKLTKYFSDIKTTNVIVEKKVKVKGEWITEREVEVVENKTEAKIITVSELLDDLRSSQFNGDYFGRLNYYKNLKGLFIDDIGVEKYSEFGEEQIYKILNYRYENKKYTFMTSNLKPSELGEKYSQRLFSRIVEMCEIVELGGKDRRLEKVSTTKM